MLTGAAAAAVSLIGYTIKGRTITERSVMGEPAGRVVAGQTLSRPQVVDLAHRLTEFPL